MGVIKDEQSILHSIRETLGINYDEFDTDIIMYINSSFAVLTDLGVGPKEGYIITDEGNLWQEFTNDATVLSLVKSYIALKVKMLFDPAANSFTQDAQNKVTSEYEWRLHMLCDKSTEDQA